jgi:CMP-N-acetylneuraminic acid synthetase
MILGIIPAKSFSRRIKNKNLYKFKGKHIFEYTVDNLKKSKIFDEIHISTESKKIADIATKHNLKPKFLRQKKLTKNMVGLNDVIRFVLDEYNKRGLRFKTVCLAYATAPLLTPMDFRNAYKKFNESDKKFPLLSVGKYKPSLEMSMIKKNIILHPKDEKLFFKDTKKNSDVFYDSGSFMFFNPSNFFSKKKFCYYYYELPYYKSIDIDTPEDMKIAEKLFLLKDR